MQRRMTLSCVSALALAACAHNGDGGKGDPWPHGPLGDFLEGTGLRRLNNENATGASNAFTGAGFEKIDLLHLIDPERRRYKVCKVALKSGGDEAEPRNEAWRSREVECAHAAFYTYGK